MRTTIDLIKVNEVVYLDVETILEIHDILITTYKGSNDEIVRGEANTGNIFWNNDMITRIGGELAKEEIIIYKAANLMNNFFTSHAFADGNKRTGFAIFGLFLAINDVPFVVDEENYMKHVSFFKKMAMKKTKDDTNVDEIIEWYNTNS